MNVVTTVAVASNIKLIQSVYEAFGRGDVAFIVGRVTDDTQWDFAVADSDVPWHSAVHGHAGVPHFLAAFADNVALATFEPRHFVASGDDVIVDVHLAYTVRKTGKPVDEDQLHWWSIRDGKVTRLRHFEDTRQVIDAWHG